MKKLKIILLYNWFFYVIFFFSILYCLIYINLPHDSIYNLNDNSFKIKITDIFVDGNYLSLQGINKEKIQGVYYFKSLEEKRSFLDNYSLGDVIYIRGNLTIPRNNTNPNLFNYKKYLYYDGIYYILNIEQYKKISDNKDCLYQLKNTILKRINNIQKASPYLKALILGDDRYISSDTMDIYRSVGISHLFAISGMHITVLSGILLLALKKIRINEKIRYFIVIIFLLIYLFITGMSPSVLRATILFILLSINKIFKLEVKTFNIFLLTISIIIVMNPFIIFKIGFQFSAIVSGTLILYSYLINKSNNYFHKLIMTSFISFLVGVPLSIYNFYQINILSIIYNIFFVPFMSFLLFPLILLTFLFPILEGLLLIVINILEETANICSFIPSILILRKPSLIIIGIYFFIIFSILRKWHKHKKLLVLFIVILGIHYNYNHIFSSDYMIVLDVGQGDSILIHSRDENILIDTGGRIEYNKEKWEIRNYNKSITSSTIIPLLKSLGIKHLDYLVLTHGDYDHMGEAVNLVSDFKVNKVIFNCGPHNDLENELIRVLDKRKIKYYSCINKLNIDKYKLDFLNTETYDNENDNSNVIYFNYNGYKFLFMGDAGVEKEKDILDKFNLKDIDFLKVGHHGSNTSSSEEFINSINPKTSLISVGKNNRYGHPKQSVLDNLKGSKIYRTDLNGSVEIKLSKNGYKIRTCAP